MRERLAAFAPKTVVVVTTIVLVILLVLSVLLGREVLRQLSDLSTATTDNVQWNMSQSEVEHLRLQAATKEALEGGSLDLVRRRFDVFYSRVATFHESPLFAELRSSGEGAKTLARIQNRLNNFVPLIDGPDRLLRDAMPDFAVELVANGRDVRTMTLLGLVAHTQSADAKRQGMSQTLQRLGWVVMALFLALALTALMIGCMYHRGRILTAASNVI